MAAARVSSLALCAAWYAIRVTTGAPVDAAQATIAQDLRAATSEEAALRLLEPYMDRLSVLDAATVEHIVQRQWFGLAKDVVAKAHLQKIDFSGPVRKGVKSLREDGEELLRRLNPKYGQAQLVNPAFQWAQSDTSIFLNIKYTVRWNAPGALDITEPSVNMSFNVFNFSALGQHSNNKYRYFLNLRLFDYFDEEASTWSMASVGKVSVTLKKRFARKWPRLLANKKLKIGNMHVWIDQQERQDEHIERMHTSLHSPVTCGEAGKLYCLRMDVCKAADKCSECPGKLTADEKIKMCQGPPAESGTIEFQDEDLTPKKIGGKLEIYNSAYDVDIDSYRVYFGSDASTKLGDQPLQDLPKAGNKIAVQLKGVAVPAGATHLLVYSANAYGESAAAGSRRFQDKAAPGVGPASLEFEDEDPDVKQIGGTITIISASGMSPSDHSMSYEVHWGKSAKTKIPDRSHLVGKQAHHKETTLYIPRDTRVPVGATHLLAYATNADGEHPKPAVVKLDDATRPCVKRSEKNCPQGVVITEDADPDPDQAQLSVHIRPAVFQDGLWHYSIYWGRHECDAVANPEGKLQRIAHRRISQGLDYVLPADTPVPAGARYILVFSASRFGESDLCVSTPFVDDRSSLDSAGTTRPQAQQQPDSAGKADL